jgi:hypothetical protein
VRKMTLTKVLRNPQRAAEFRDWRRTAYAATADVAATIQRGEKPKFKKEIWAELKRWLFTYVFFEKCAYCEGKVTPQSFGVAEHWRPKSEVTVRSDDVVIHVAEGGRKHPGYWWLAYEWTNLLPACEHCNSGTGKNSQFPIAGRYAYDPDQVADVDALDRQEQPLLLHPLRGDDPYRHLEFDDLGLIRPRDGSLLGSTSIAVFDLKRGPLKEARLKRIQEADAAITKALRDMGEYNRDLDQSLQLWLGPDAPYSAALWQHVERRLERYIEQSRAQHARLVDARQSENSDDGLQDDASS